MFQTRVLVLDWSIVLHLDQSIGSRLYILHYPYTRKLVLDYQTSVLVQDLKVHLFKAEYWSQTRVLVIYQCIGPRLGYWSQTRVLVLDQSIGSILDYWSYRPRLEGWFQTKALVLDQSIGPKRGLKQSTSINQVVSDCHMRRSTPLTVCCCVHGLPSGARHYSRRP